MSKELKRLQNRAAAVAARLAELSDSEDRSEEQDEEIRSLLGEVDSVKAKIKHEEEIVAKLEEVRSSFEQAAPAQVEPEVAPVAVAEERAVEETEEKKVEIRSALPHHSELRAFNVDASSVEQAYRFSKWVGATFYHREDDKRWCKDHGVESRALTGAADTSGIVPTEFAATLIRLLDRYGVYPKLARQMMMSSDVLNVPKQSANVTANFFDEATTITPGDPTLVPLTITAKKVAVATRISAEYMQDTLVSVSDWLLDDFAVAVAKRVDECGLIADGSATYGGMTGAVEKLAAGSIVTAASGNTSVETLDIDDWLAAIGKCPSYARPGAAWVMSPVVFAASVQKLMYNAGGSNMTDVANGAVARFLGYPVYLSDVMDGTLGADAGVVKALFGDFKKGAILGRRLDFSARVYDQTYAASDELLVIGKHRFGSLVHDAGTASAAGAIVGLKTAAS